MKQSSVHLSTSEKLGFISNLSTMLAAGIPILETIDSLLEDARGNQKKLLESLREDLIQGNQISSAFEKFPKVFDKITVNLLRAAEQAGTLDTTLNDLKLNIKKEAEFRDQIKSAMTYPIFIGFVFVGVLLMILTVVIPKISTVFLRLKVNLPLPTKILIVASNFIVHNTIFFLLSAVAFVAFAYIIYRTQKGLFFQVLFSLPLISNLVKEIDLARFSRSMYLLLSAGIPITLALELAHEVVLRRDLSLALVNAQQVIFSGKKFSDGLKDAKHIIPSIMIKITEAGEKSGSLDRSMQEISEYLDYQVSASLRTATALLEPIMLVFVGVLVGGMMLAIIAPIYNLIGQVGIR